MSAVQFQRDAYTRNNGWLEFLNYGLNCVTDVCSLFEHFCNVEHMKKKGDRSFR